MREGSLGGKCGACEYREACGGCRARAFADSGDVLAADDSCAYEPKGGDVIQTSRPITLGAAVSQELQWTDDAKARVARIPSFVRGIVTSRVEDYARGKGLSVVTVDLLDTIRKEMPLDFSKRLPFFARPRPED
jgi:hypothetical protein